MDEIEFRKRQENLKTALEQGLFSEMAKIDYAMFLGWINQGFSRKEALELLKIQITSRSSTDT